MKFKLIIFLYSFLSISNNNCMNIDEAMDAVINGDMDKVLRFLNKGNLNSTDINSLLRKAIFHEKEQIAEMLILRGANVDFIDISGPLHIAAIRSTTITELLLRNNANPNLVTRSGNTPLHHLLVMFGPSICESPKDIEIIKLLLNYRADPRLLNDDGKKAAYYTQNKVIIDLLEEAEKRFIN